MSSLFSWQGSFKSALLFRSVLFRDIKRMKFCQFCLFLFNQDMNETRPTVPLMWSLLSNSLSNNLYIFWTLLTLWTKAFFYENLMFKLTVMFKETLSTMIILVPRTRRDRRLLFWVIDRRCCCSWNRNCPNICKHRTLQVSSKYWASAPLEHYIPPSISL